MARFRFGARTLASLTLLGALTPSTFAAPTAEQLLAYKPKQTGVDITSPTGQEIGTCTVDLEKIKTLPGGKQATAWVVKDASGRTLRKFHDTTGANSVDQFSYFRDGEECYRESDTNGNGKIDQYRWVGPGGSKIGADVDEDGKIDTWTAISPEEVSQEVLAAVVTKDFKRLEALMPTKADLTALGLPEAELSRIQKKMASASGQFQKTCTDLAKISPNTIWVHLETKQPQTIPSDVLGSSADLVRYKHATILYQEGEGQGAKHNWIQTGELIQIGRAWRIISAPIPGVTPAEDPSSGVAGPGRLPTGSEKLVEQLKDHDQKGPSKAGREGIVEFNLKRAGILEQIAAMCVGEFASSREVWVRQAIESYTAAAQNMDKPAIERLTQWRTAIAKDQPNSPLLAYVQFREMSAIYAQQLATAGSGKPAEIQKLQDNWRDQLSKFVSTYPKSEDAPDALMQLGMLNEFIDKVADAKTWYEKLAKDFPGHALGKKAQGCLNRLNLEGAPFNLTGQTLAGAAFNTQVLRGKAFVVYFWASWNGSAQADLGKIKQAMTALGGKAELVCVNLDSKPADANAFLQANPIPGTHLYAPGGQDGAIATEHGITVLPMMFLVGPDGKVISRNAQISSLEDDLKKAVGAAKDK